jgi:unsaturated rhamnogalacturonyl hydrolase
MKRLILAITTIALSTSLSAQKTPNFKVVNTSFKKDTLNIVQFGAVSNGYTLNTLAINKAIDKMHAKGGGVVVIPAGEWMTGPIVLKSNVNLHVAKGALVIFTPDLSQYPLVVSSYEGVDAARCQSPITAESQENIAITGLGTLNGNGLYWRPLKKEKLSEGEWKNHQLLYGGALTDDKKTWYPSKAAVEAAKLKDIGKLVGGKKLADFEPIKDFLRPNMVRINNCKRVLIEGISLENSPAWTAHVALSSQITVRGLRVKNPWWGTNNDAIDLESSSNVLMEDCVFDTGDDGITLKSGRDEDGRKRGMPTQNVIVKNCTVYHSHGGFVVGSEMSGGVKNIYVSDCNFIGSDIGLRFKSTRGRGGVVENIYVHNVNMKDIAGEAILFDMYYQAVDPVRLPGDAAITPVIEKVPVTEATPQFQNFYIDHIVCNGASKALFVRGLPEMPIKNVQLSDMFIQSTEGMRIQEAAGIHIKTSTILTKALGPVLKVSNSTDIQIDTIAIKKFNAGPTSLAQKMAATAMQIWPDSFSLRGSKARWSYDQGVILKGMEGLWRLTGDAHYFDYIQHSMDYYVQEDGTVLDYKKDDYNIDNLNNGKSVVLLYQVTGKEKYRKAISAFKSQLDNHPRNTQGGFWHKKAYPNQMWLDGLYMGAAFYAQFAAAMHDTAAFNDITHQFVLIEKNTRDAATGLMYHAWDESKQQKWADPITGRSPHVWARAMGWYGVALVDALEYFPRNHPGRDSLIQIVQRFAAAIVKVQDPASGVWLDILDAPTAPKNYKEASASSMFVTTLFKAVRNGYISNQYLAAAKKGYAGLVNNFIKEEDGQVNLYGTVSVSGLGGNPYRDGSLDYYFGEKVVVNDAKGIGAFLQASVESEMAALPKPGLGKNVILDAYYNNEVKKNVLGYNTRWHYDWDEQSNNGFRFLGNVFEQQGATISVLDQAPTKKALGNKSIYLIVDPDNVRDNPTPNYMQAAQADLIANWVKEGGVLMLMANDSNNCDLVHFNILASKFGIQFTNNSVNMVKGTAFEMGAIFPTPNTNVFRPSLKMYLKEVSALQIQAPATSIAHNGTSDVMAIAPYGKGWVMAVGDPWIYNEYVDGRKLPASFENFEGAKTVANWLLNKVK